MKKTLKFLILTLVVFLGVSCSTDSKTNENQEAIDFTEANEQEITDYLKANELEAEKTASGLYYTIEEEGSGNNPTATSTVRLAYKGFFTNGNTFDESNEEGISFALNRVIAGWAEGITLFKEGGKGKLIIPSRLTYGNFGRSGIPGGSVLVFYINLLEIVE